MAEYQEFLDFAIDLGRKAGEMIKDGQAKRFAQDSSLDTKANAIDFSARIGGGAYLNETTPLPLTGRPQPLETLQECVVSFEFSRLAADAAMNGAMVHGIRSTGASTAALVSVAAGGIDIYW
ncbi:hypothetical protein QFC19_002552 [Naganishia cerealis]|uniref:Uncharacterized protein n=1 Tax=Naganishia cerealis TaxID=610337 RepID=A0ACC2WAJ2_9TREE|nr:hypothetical protein QFC19_002552 [Naganishia cerealis]